MTPADRFDKFVRRDAGDGCWLWTGHTAHGYGRFRCEGRMVYAHRFAWEQVHGPVPDELELDHTCREKLCVRPSHLDLVTHGENMRRAVPFRQPRGPLGPRERDETPDIELLRVIRRLRTVDGACTVRSAATAMGMSVAGMQHRIDRAINLGHVERSEVAGSIRVSVAAGNLHDLVVGGSEDHVEVVVTDNGEILDARVV